MPIKNTRQAKQIGSLGGVATREKYGRKHYSQLAKRGIKKRRMEKEKALNN